MICWKKKGDELLNTISENTQQCLLGQADSLVNEADALFEDGEYHKAKGGYKKAQEFLNNENVKDSEYLMEYIGKCNAACNTALTDVEVVDLEELRKELKIQRVRVKPKEGILIERAVYDPCNRDFLVDRKLSDMKKWGNRHDASAYWFAISIQNNTDGAINEWSVDLVMSAAITVTDAKIEGIEYEVLDEKRMESYKISVPKEYGITIPKGGAKRVYFKLRAKIPKTMYEISGIFKSKITGDVPIRAKEFKYLCDTSQPTLKKMLGAELALALKEIQEIDRMRLSTSTKVRDINQKLNAIIEYLRLRGYERFIVKVNDFKRKMNEELFEYLDDSYVQKLGDFRTEFHVMVIRECL